MKTLKLLMALIIATFIMVPGSSLQAQENEKDENLDRFKQRAEKFEKLRSFKIAYISEHLELTPEEAEKFWPVYNEMENKRESITHDLLKEFFNPEERPAEISDEMAEEIMQKRFKQEGMLLELKKEYHVKLKKIISPAKVLKLYEAENNFKRGLMERFKKRDGERKPEGKGAAPPQRGRRMHR